MKLGEVYAALERIYNEQLDLMTALRYDNPDYIVEKCEDFYA